MPDNQYTDVTMLLDRSGSMQVIKSDIEGGFDAFIAEQRTQPGVCKVSLAQFDDQYEHVYAGLDVADVPPLDLQPRGSTALLDAIGRVVRETGERLDKLPEAERPKAVIVGIMTDGLENASTEMTYPAVKAVIEAYEKGRGWVFTYMGANQDAIEVGSAIGVQAGRAMTYDLGPKGASATMRGHSRLVTRARLAAARDADDFDYGAAVVFTDAERQAAAGN